jgi:hypothetical protein
MLYQPERIAILHVMQLKPFPQNVMAGRYKFRAGSAKQIAQDSCRISHEVNRHSIGVCRPELDMRLPKNK